LWSGARLPSTLVSGERATRRISLGLSDAAWNEVLEEIDRIALEDRFAVSLSEDGSVGRETGRLVDLISRGYSWDLTAALDERVLIPRPAGVLYLVSPLGPAATIPTGGAHMPASHFRQYLLAMDMTEETFAHVASSWAGESWHLDAFAPRTAWAEFIMEFVASREIDLVQIIAARQGVDLAPALRAAYPFIRVVVDVDGASVEDRTWLAYATSRYGNVIDAFCVPDFAVAEQLHQAGVSASKVRAGRRDPGEESAAAIHRETYGRLLATAVN
jgi:hypothetical protein